MMPVFDYDILVIGGGLLGCFAARSFTRYNCTVVLVEKKADVCTEISRGNTAILYPGYDPRPGSLKARLSVAAAGRVAGLCRELDVPYKVRGSLMTAFGPRGKRVLEEKYAQGLENGVAGLRILEGAEVRALEPRIHPAVLSALYAPGAGTLNPWELGIAAAENAVANGARLMTSASVAGMERIPGGYRVRLADRGRPLTARVVVNAAGLHADVINDMVAKPRFRIRPSKAGYIVLDNTAEGYIRHIIQHEPEERGKGATLVPTVDGNILLGPSKERATDKGDFSTTADGLHFVWEMTRRVCPGFPEGLAIRTFASLRPDLEMVEVGAGGEVVPTGERFHDFLIYQPGDAPGLINLAGIKTPGLSCADEIGRYVAEIAAGLLGNPGENPNYDPRRRGIQRPAALPPGERDRLTKNNPAYGEILCRCRGISRGEVLDAIRREPGARTLDGVKRRTGALMGRCQGGYCAEKIIKILAGELGRPVNDICKDEPGSWLVREGHGL